MRSPVRLTVAAAATAGAIVLGGLALAASSSDGSTAGRTATSPTASVRHWTAPAAAPTGAPVTTVVTLGDSIMAGLGLDPSQAWPELLADEQGIAVSNLGCSGAGFTVPGACGTDFAGLISQAVAASPTVVIIQASDNDAESSDDSIAADTAQTITALHDALPGVRIVGLSTLWTQSAPAPATIDAASAALRDAIASVGGTYVDIGQPLAGRPDLLQADDEHPTTEGQQVLLRAIDTALTNAGVLH